MSMSSGPADPNYASVLSKKSLNPKLRQKTAALTQPQSSLSQDPSQSHMQLDDRRRSASSQSPK